ncbi:DEAD/DEAH box helicase [Luteipulveratus sp. YIM 133132]|uniref:DEAD/DEAH box helicase n=1 Tax=Luteipulveratus flavus TaxID=3031728 RepID=UPI0023AF7550|nr:DEAD/DEAH box helicase [Luteipulveratus sp. YIM 133132]MDE9367782.1 DEAD/DEAH box helicase [Luteipulveratus sp. YIM 133132]
MKASRPGQSHAPKKARWTRTQKVEAQRAAVRKQVKSNRADAARDDRPGGDDRRNRDERWTRDDRGRGRDDRGGYQGRNDGDRGGYRGSRDRDDRGGYQGRGDSDRGGYRGSRDRDDRSGFRGRDDRSRGGYGERRDRDDRGGYQGRNDGDRGGYRGSRDRDDRGGYQGRNDRGGYQGRNDGDRGGYRGSRDRDDRGGYQGRNDRRERPSFDRGPSERRERPAYERRDNRGGADQGHEQSADLVRDSAPQAPTKPAPHERVDLSDNGFAALGLPDAIAERLARDGITTPFPIQAATIPDALAGKDVLGRGRTGSGKTLSFGLPTLARLAAGGKARPHQPRAIVLTPTRELAMQVSDALQPLVHVVGLRHKLVAGGMPYEPQLQALERGVDLLIATPGRLSDLIERGAADLSRVEVAILDEADHMAEMGFLEAITEILDLIPEGGQRLLFSATLDRGIDTLVEKYLVDPVTHSTDDAQASVTTMSHHALLIEPRDKKAVTAEVANRPGRTVVFCRTKLGADRIAGELRDLGVVAAALHGGLNQSQRNKVLSAFKDGRVPVLVATDVAARGIHVDDVGVVLQVDPPADHKDYLHRAGRTARAGEEGTVVTLALPHQRRTVQRLLDDAGVDTQLQRAQPGDAVIADAGGSTPDGHPVSDDDLYRLLTPARSGRGGPRRGGYGQRSGGYGQRSGGYGQRSGGPGQRSGGQRGGYRGDRDRGSSYGGAGRGGRSRHGE